MSPSPLGFGTVPVGNSVMRAESIRNPGPKKVILTGAVLSGSGLRVAYHPLFPHRLRPGASVAFNLIFAPQLAGTVTGTLTVYYKYPRNGSWYRTWRAIHVSGMGAATSGSLGVNPSSLNFGTVQISATKTLPETVRNSGRRAVTISQMAVTGTGFAFSGISPPVTLGTGQSATFKVTFRPQASGSVVGKLTINSNASNRMLAVPLSGSGSAAGKIVVSPSSVNFGSVTVGTAKTQAGTISAVNGPVTISATKVTGSEFSVSGISFPLTLNTGQSSSYKLVFAPTASGTTSATVTWLSSASNSPLNQPLTGTGGAGPQHSVTLSWNASTSRNVVGYNIYRGNVSGGPYTRINTTPDPHLQNVDNNVQGGHTYYYVVTAVDSAGAESVYSGQVKAVVPYP
ncbi:MAG: choice-of-anchor D domain-containing protein [Acidobacteria bacterium]|nr:choice-of-anchor D domain-containing protein [Acidobacteriota bacterium]